MGQIAGCCSSRDKNMKSKIELAAQKLAPYIEETRCIEYPGRPNIWLKLESEQVTGSFKARGGGNKILTLTPDQRAKGIVAASTGNHGCGVSYMAGKMEPPVKVEVYCPENASEEKINKMKDLGAEVIPFGEGHDNEVHARKMAGEQGKVFISPYNDWDVVTGQGTIGVEILKQVEDVDIVYVACGGGGMIGGISLYINAVKPNVEIVACEPEADPCMHLSLQAGEVVDNDHEPTLSEGTAGGIEKGSITFGIAQRMGYRSVKVSEDDIKKAMKDCHERLDIQIEGSAGVALAACINDKTRGDKKAVVIICGGNIGRDTFDSIIEDAGTFDDADE